MILGLSESQAKKKVVQELANQVGEAAASGALMSFSFFAAGISQKSVVNDINTNIENAIIQLWLNDLNILSKGRAGRPVFCFIDRLIIRKDKKYEGK